MPGVQQKAYANKSRRDCEFEKGQQVLLSTRNIRLKSPGTRKLLPKYVGPFRIVKRDARAAYKLGLPAIWGRMHDVFHASLLKPWVPTGRYQQPPPAVMLEGELGYFIDRILDHRDVTTRSDRLVEEHGT